MEKLSSDQKLQRSARALQHASKHAVDYLETLNQSPVAPAQESLDQLTLFDETLTEHGCSELELIDQLHQIGSPNTVATAGGRYYGLVVGGSLPACVGSKTLMAAWDQLGTTQFTSPVTAKLEQVASKWVLELFGLEPSASVGFVTGTTMGNLVCIAAARHALLARQGWDVEKQGLMGSPKLRILASAEVHFTVKKVLAILGFGTAQIEPLAVDADGAIDPDALPEIDSTCLILTQAGNVNSGAIDPIGGIARRARTVGAWVHVDGAFGLWAAASRTKRSLIQGFELADSWVTDGHKWLNTPYDCGIAICRHPEFVHNAMATTAPYFVQGANIDAKDMMPELSRSARGVDIWAAFKNLGKFGIESLVDRNCEFAEKMAEGLRKLGFDVLNKVVLNQVVATHVDFENDIDDFVERVVQSGDAWFGVTHWKGRNAFRISFSSWVTTEEDVIITLKAIENAKRSMS